MINKLRFLLPLLIFVLMIILFKIGLGKDPNLLPSILVDKALPPFSSASLLQANELVTNNSLKGKVTLLNVWATWCESCRIEHPLLIDLAKTHSIQLYGLNYKDEQHVALNYLNKMGNPYRNIIYDPEGKVAMQLGVYGTPESFLIDKKGIVRYRYVGPITLDVLEKDLLPRIKKIERENS